MRDKDDETLCLSQSDIEFIFQKSNQRNATQIALYLESMEHFKASWACLRMHGPFFNNAEYLVDFWYLNVWGWACQENACDQANFARLLFVRIGDSEELFSYVFYHISFKILNADM